MSLNPWTASGGAAAIFGALKQSFAVIEFRPDGVILDANPLFCATMGYRIDEIRGRHHSLFVDPAYAQSEPYKQFWRGLGQGQFDSGEYKRLGKSGAAVWLRASYTPVTDGAGRVVKVVKLALDITKAKTKAAEDASLIQAIQRSQAVIEFSLNGEILDANDNFLKVVGYGRAEIVGQRHAMFATPVYAASPEYARFWENLRKGEYLTGEFCRVGKGGREIWLEATYNPIYDADGKLTKVVKFAMDLTQRMADVTCVGDALSRLADGDLNRRIDTALMPSLDKLRLDFNAAAETLFEALRVVSSGASAIQSGASEISMATGDLSRRTEQQAANLEETAAALDQITATVRRTAEGAVQARDAMAAAKTDAERSGRIVQDAVTAMGGIEQSSKEINQIIGVIDEIAFQTNLLALNAGVEAARAGDAGRGFAVVASEVRALAQRSADAAKQIKTLISASTQHVASGVDLVGETGRALSRIASQVSEMNGVIAEIAASAQEQATGLNEVNSAVNQMDQMTQKNAAMVEQTTAASLNLANEGQELTRLISRFDLGGTSTGGARAGRAASKAA
jgi:methyl-accepting chemotaxis protein